MLYFLLTSASHTWEYIRISWRAGLTWLGPKLRNSDSTNLQAGQNGHLGKQVPGDTDTAVLGPHLENYGLSLLSAHGHSYQSHWWVTTVDILCLRPRDPFCTSLPQPPPGLGNLICPKWSESNLPWSFLSTHPNLLLLLYLRGERQLPLWLSLYTSQTPRNYCLQNSLAHTLFPMPALTGHAWALTELLISRRADRLTANLFFLFEFLP